MDLLNELPVHSCTEAFRSCCGSALWTNLMVGARPFESRENLFSDADKIWWGLPVDEWHDAFAAHPR